MKAISIVGAGPGAIDLMTIRAIDRIKKADVLLWTDSLICPEIITLVSSNCEKIKTSSLTLEEIIPLMIKKHQEGKKIVRLHDGDPCLYGAISEQICALNDLGIEIEVIPGISAYQATASALCTELTIPGVTQTIILSRAEGRTGKPESESLEKLASLKASLCLYLSARHVDEVQSTLLKYYPETTLVAIGFRVSWEDQYLEIVPLKQMAKKTKDEKLIRTTLYIISPTFKQKRKRSRLYSPNYNHLFRPIKK